MSELILNICFPGNVENFILKINNNILCQTFKKIINKKIKNDINNIRLYYNNKMLNNDRTLFSYNIQTNSTINVIFLKR